MLVPKIQLEKRGAEADAKGMVFALRHVTSFQYLNNSSPGPWECWTTVR